MKIRYLSLLIVASMAITVALPIPKTVAAVNDHHSRRRHVVLVKIVANRATVGAYKPAKIVVHVGQTIEFKNLTNTVHTVTADNFRAFHSPNVTKPRPWFYRARRAGTFKYHCVYHPFMLGTIVVKKR